MDPSVASLPDPPPYTDEDSRALYGSRYNQEMNQSDQATLLVNLEEPSSQEDTSAKQQQPYPPFQTSPTAVPYSQQLTPPQQFHLTEQQQPPSPTQQPYLQQAYPAQLPYPVQQYFPAQQPYPVQQPFAAQQPYPAQQRYPSQQPYPAQQPYSSQQPYPYSYEQPQQPQYYSGPPPTSQQQQQNSVMVINTVPPPLIGDVRPVYYESYNAHFALAIFVTFFCGLLFGLIAFILIWLASERAGAGHLNEARHLGRASVGVSIAGIVIGFILIIVVVFAVKAR